MKKVCLAVLAIGLFASCNKKEDPSPASTGFLELNLKVNLTVSESPGRMSGVNTDNFKVMIFDIDHNQALKFEKAEEMPPLIELPPGQYYVVANSNNLVPAAFESPYYAGQSTVFSIAAQETSQAAVECTLANCMVTVEYSNFVRERFDAWETEASVSGASLIFNQNETRPGYFKLSPIAITARLSDAEGKIKTIRGEIPDPKPKTLYKIMIDVSREDGDAAIDITVNEEVDTVRLTFNKSVITPPTGEIITADQLQYGDLIFTEIMADPKALDDEEGEWLEIYNLTDYCVNLNGLRLIDNTSDIAINQDVYISPKDYLAIATTDTAFTNPGFVMPKLRLTNTGEILSLVAPSDEEIAVLDYSMIPVKAGTSTNLCRNHFSAEEAQMPEYWCKSNTPYNTGDLGTPGTENITCP